MKHEETFGLISEAILRLSNALKNISSVQCAWIFGSRARSCYREDSDLDFAVLLNPTVGKVLADWILNSREWKEEIQNYVGCDVNIDLQLASPVHAEIVWEAIDKDGVLIFERHSRNQGIG